jgi:hypothetical protein
MHNHALTLGSLIQRNFLVQRNFLIQTLTIGSFTAIALLGLPAVGMATQKAENTPKNPYPEEIVTGYVEECSSAGGEKVPKNIMNAICVCTIEEFQNTYTLKEFKKIGEAIEQGRTKDVPPQMTTITEDCVKEVLTPPNT